MTAQAGSASSLSDTSLKAERSILRQQLRQQRRSISRQTQQAAARQLAIQFDRCYLLRPGLHIAVYLAMPHEFDLHAFIARAQARHCHIYFPHIDNKTRRQMRFVPLSRNVRLTRHSWGMQQVQQPPRQAIGLRQLDMVLVPTVGFDVHGNRLGMGAGFYDRHLACLRHSRWQRPRLIGVAYASQQVERIPALPHDITLPRVMTEQGLIHCHQQRT